MRIRLRRKLVALSLIAPIAQGLEVLDLGSALLAVRHHVVDLEDDPRAYSR